MRPSNFKSTIILFTLFLLIIVSCRKKESANDTFSLSATVADVQSGQAILFLYNKETKGIDTIAYSEVTNGSFRFDSANVAFTEPTKFSLMVRPSKEEMNGRGYSKKFVILDNKPLHGKFGVWDKVSEIPECKYHDLLINIDNHYPNLRLYKDSMAQITKQYREEFTAQEKKDKLAEVQEKIKNLNETYREFLTHIVTDQYQQTDDIIYKGLLLDVYGQLFELEDYVEHANSVLPQLNSEGLTHKNIVTRLNEYQHKLAVGVGKKNINFSLNDLSNKQQALDDVLRQNEYVLLDFWASWCSPCRKDIPILKDIHSKYHSKGFDIFMVSIDTNEDKWKIASEEEQLSWINTIDNKSVKDLYGVTYIPQNFLINKNQEIVGVNLRDKELESKLNELLNL